LPENWPKISRKKLIFDYMVRKNRFVVDFHITGFCNLSCPFCCGTPKRVFGPSFRSIQLVINKLLKIGVTTIVLTGGEPLVRPDLTKIIKYLHLKGLEVYLSTNGLLLLKYWPQIKKYLNCLGLPLDGSTGAMSEKMGRSLKSYQAVLKILKFFKKNKPSCIVKVGTVVSKVNQGDVIKIGQLIFENKDLYSPDIWRLYQFSPLSFGAIHRSKYEIGDKRFNRLCQKIKQRFPKHDIIPLSNADSNDSYFFIDPLLKIVLLTKDKFVEIGDLKTVSLKFLKKLKREYDGFIQKSLSNRRWLSR